MGLDDTSGGADGAVIDHDPRKADLRILETQITTEEQADDSFGQLPSSSHGAVSSGRHDHRPSDTLGRCYC